jgi:hypothetical protein
MSQRQRLAYYTTKIPPMDDEMICRYSELRHRKYTGYNRTHAVLSVYREKGIDGTMKRCLP